MWPAYPTPARPDRRHRVAFLFLPPASGASCLSRERSERWGESDRRPGGGFRGVAAKPARGVSSSIASERTPLRLTLARHLPLRRRKHKNSSPSRVEQRAASGVLFLPPASGASCLYPQRAERALGGVRPQAGRGVPGSGGEADEGVSSSIASERTPPPPRSRSAPPRSGGGNTKTPPPAGSSGGKRVVTLASPSS